MYAVRDIEEIKERLLSLRNTQRRTAGCVSNADTISL